MPDISIPQPPKMSIPQPPKMSIPQPPKMSIPQPPMKDVYFNRKDEDNQNKIIINDLIRFQSNNMTTIMERNPIENDHYLKRAIDRKIRWGLD
jgi:hypothetical protein